MAAGMAGVRRYAQQLMLPILLCAGSAQAADEALFPRPAGLEPAVAFWVDIYTRVQTNSGVLHDTRELDIVYETMTFPDGASRRARNRKINAQKKHFATVLRSLGNGKRQNLTAEEQRVLALWPRDVSNATLKQAAKRLRFQLGQADRFEAGLVRSGEYKPFISETLAQRRLPGELAALPHVESSFEPRAYSKVGAAGLWQFTRSTGRRYMRVDHVVDERRDPFLSTVAAARLLENNYSITGSWPLAITGYNHGVAGMRRAAQQLGTTDIETIVRKYKGRTFGFASRNFYAAFLAALQVDTHPEAYFGPVFFKPAAQHKLVELNDYVPADGLSAVLNMDLPTLQYYNPALQEPVWNGSKHLPRGYTLRLPADRAKDDPAAALANLDPGMRFAQQLPDVTHRVRRGETLSVIADRYGLRVSDLVAMNSLRSRHRIRAGQTLNLPTRGQPVPAQAPIEAPQAVLVAAIPEPPVEPAPAPTERLGEGADADLSTTADLMAAIAVAEAEEPDELDASLVDTSTDLVADPSDYSIADDGSIEIQALETLGHYADWLEIRTQRLRDMNGYSFQRPVVVGGRIKLDLSRIDAATFEARRVEYHRSLQGEFFSRFKIQDTRIHTVRRGESLWVLANRTYSVPVWLLRQFNPDLDLNRTQPGTRVQFPLLEPIVETATPEQRIASS